MTNEEAKELYQRGVQKLEGGDYPGALAAFDALEADRPNSKSVMYHRALCLLRLGRVAEARELSQKLEGKLEPERMAELRAKLAAAEPRANASAPGAPASGERNVFLIESVYPVSTTQTTVTGLVETGVLHTGDTLTLLSSEGLLLEAPILRIGTAETPLNLVRAGQKTVLLLSIDPSHATPGMRATSSAQAEAYAATMVVSSEPAEDSVVERNAELMEVERAFKRGDFAAASTTLDAYLQKDPRSIAGYRLLARLHLESPDHNDPKGALQAIRKAYELGGAEDPAVIGVLAQALAANGEAEQGLRFLERLYSGNLPVEARMALNKRIQEFRAEHQIGHVWEFADNYGEVVFEAKSMAEVAKAMKNKTIPLDAKCRRDRVGDWRPIEVALAPGNPEIAALYQPGGQNKGLGAVIFVLIAVVLIALIAVVLMIS